MKRREEKLILCIYHIFRAFVLIIINVTLFLSSWTIKCFFLISVILYAGCNEIKSNIVNSRICLVAKRVKKEGENKNTKWENSRDRYGCIYVAKHIKKHLLESGRNSQWKKPHELSVISFLKIQNKSKIFILVDFLTDFLKY